VGSNPTPSAVGRQTRLAERVSAYKRGVVHFAGHSGRDRLRPLEAGAHWRMAGAFRPDLRGVVFLRGPPPAEAKAWRSDAQRELRRGSMRAARAPTLRPAADAFLSGARSGEIRNRSGDLYKPSAIRGYDEALRLRLLPAIGAHRLDAIRRADLQRLVARMTRDGASPSTIRNTIMPLRAIYRYAIADDRVAVDPTTGLALPAVRAQRNRSLHLRKRPGCSLPLTSKTARCGPPRCTRGCVGASCRHSRGTTSTLQPTPSKCTGLTTPRPNDRARSAWLAADLEPIGLHECRHTFASLMIAAGVNVKALATFMGHASITITLDRYGHMHSGQRERSRPTARRLPLPGICQGYLSRKAPQTIPLAVRCN
jgi:integrase